MPAVYLTKNVVDLSRQFVYGVAHRESFYVLLANALLLARRES